MRHKAWPKARPIAKAIAACNGSDFFENAATASNQVRA
jgi:hypothetical protein